jgi:hypothetical protein
MSIIISILCSSINLWQSLKKVPEFCWAHTLLSRFFIRWVESTPILGAMKKYGVGNRVKTIVLYVICLILKTHVISKDVNFCMLSQPSPFFKFLPIRVFVKFLLLILFSLFWSDWLACNVTELSGHY